MTNKNILKKWETFINIPKYKRLFLMKKEKWYFELQLIKEYIEKNNSLPNCDSKNLECKRLNGWIQHQKNITKEKRKQFLIQIHEFEIELEP